MTRLLRTTALACCAALVLVAPVAADQGQGRPATPADSKVTVAVALQVDGAPYDVKGRASCTHAKSATTMGISGQNWQVAHSDGSRQMILNLWRPADGSADMFSLHVSNDGKSYVTDTVVRSRGVVKPPTRGSGTVTLEMAGKGGTFTVEATSANGAKISGTVRCEAFTPPFAVAGN